MIQEVMTAGQVAKYLQLDEQTVYRKAKKGQIPAVHIGRTLRFKKDVIDGWLRLSSLNWTAERRTKLRAWAEAFAKRKGLKQSVIQKAIDKRRQQK